MDSKSIENVINNVSPNVIIHCAAQRDPEICEKNHDIALKLNVEAAKTLTQFAKKNNSKIIYISTDYVFDGRNPPYTTNDSPNPLNFYGESKYLGEKEVSKLSPNNHYILRLPILYGKVDKLEDSAILTLGRNILNKEKVKLDNWTTKYPTSTSDVAFVLKQMIIEILKDNLPSGIYHWQSMEAFTKYEMAIAMANIFKITTYHISPVNTCVGNANRSAKL